MIAAGFIAMVKRGEPEKKAIWTAVRSTSGVATIQTSRWWRPIQRPASATIGSGNRSPITWRPSTPRGAPGSPAFGYGPHSCRAMPAAGGRTSPAAPGRTRNTSSRGAICSGDRPGSAAGIPSVLMLVTASSRLRPAVEGGAVTPRACEIHSNAWTVATASRSLAVSRRDQKDEGGGA